MASSGSRGKSAAEVEYREIPLSIMRVDVRYEFDVYLRIKEEYHIFAARGALCSDQHTRLMREGVNKLYVRADDWAKIEEYKVSNLSSILTDPGVSAKEKAEVAFSTSMKTIREVFEAAEPRTISSVEKNAEEMVKLILSEDEVMDNLIWINSHDHFTYQHSVRVGIYATALLLKLMGTDLTKNQVRKLSTGYFLHDIGMTRIPMQILEKPESLSTFEWKLVRMHPLWGHESLMKTEFLSLEATNIILSHHERHDGSGYPHKKKGDDIPIYARICTIADAFESLTAQRPYRKAHEPFEALRIMYQEMSQEFDPEIFMAFVKLLGPSA